MTPSEFFDAVRAYCDALGASITSYYRTPKRNAKVGGHPHSKHMTWLGCDVVYDEPMDQARREIVAAQLSLKLVIESDHDHLQSF